MTSDLPYRPCVGIMLLNREGLVFVGKRIDQTVEGWQMPQGGIDEGETPRDAVLRELREETGTDKADIIGEMDGWLNYDLPAHLIGVAFHGRYRGQRQKWFCLALQGQGFGYRSDRPRAGICGMEMGGDRSAAAPDRAVQARYLCAGDGRFPQPGRSRRMSKAPPRNRRRLARVRLW